MDVKINDIISLIKPVLKAADVKRASIFGSFVKGTAVETSDLDIIVDFPEGKTLFDLVRLQFKLEELLQRKVDIVTFNSLHPYLKDSILSEQVVIYE